VGAEHGVLTSACDPLNTQHATSGSKNSVSTRKTSNIHLSNIWYCHNLSIENGDRSITFLSGICWSMMTTAMHDRLSCNTKTTGDDIERAVRRTRFLL
jgi:hypothetical protein